MDDGVEVAPAVMTPDQAARYLATTERHVRNMMDKRKIPFVKVGLLRRLRREDLDDWIARSSKAAQG